MDELIAAFTPEQAVRITGVSRRRLSDWYAKGLVTPRYVDDGWLKVKYLYSFRDLVALRTLLVLRETYKISLQQLRKVNDFFQAHYEDPWATLMLYVFNGEVLFDEPSLKVRMSAARPGQRMFEFPLAPIIEEAHTSVDTQQRRTAEHIGHVEARRGRLYFSGTRIPVDTVWDYLDNGLTDTDVLRSYPTLTLADVQAAVEHRPAAHASRSA